MESNFFLQTKKDAHRFDDLSLDALDSANLRSVFETYIANMQEVLYVVQAAFNLMVHADLQKRTSQLYMANQLKAKANALRGGYDQDKERINEEAALLTKSEIEGGSFKDEDVVRTVVKMLNSLENDEAVRTSNYATLRQSVVVLWSTTESLLRDTLREVLNNDNSLAVSFFESSVTNPYWNKKDLGYEHLKKHSFNLSGRMGDVALFINECTKYSAMCSAYQHLLGEESESHKVLKSRDFYRVHQLRNLIAHRNGVIDQKFLSSTDWDIGIGERFLVTPKLFNSFFQTSKSLAKSLLEDISNKAKQPGAVVPPL